MTLLHRLVALAPSLLLAACADTGSTNRTADSAAGDAVAAPVTTPAAGTATAAAASTPMPAAPTASPAADPAAAPATGPASAAPPRRVVLGGVDLTGVGYDRGRHDAPIVIVEFSDFGCPFCGSHARQTFPSLDREYVATGKAFYKYVPFVMGMFPNGRQAARSAECAAEQGKFWTMHDTLYARQAEWKKTLSPMEVLGGYATQLALDDARFRACYLQHEPFHPRTRAANDRADQLGVRVTPSFVINGRAVEGALPLPQFRQLLDELAKR